MKKIIVTFIAVFMVFIFVAFTCNAIATYITGDVNRDGVVSVIDASEIQLFIVNLNQLDETSLKAGDVDGDGTVSVMDATSIQRYIAKIIDEFPAQNLVTPTDSDGYYDSVVKP